MDFYATLTAAVNDFIEYGYDDANRLRGWIERIRQAAVKSMISEKKMKEEIDRALGRKFDSLVVKGGLVSKDVSKFTIDRLKPKLRDELDRRIVASAGLIRNNRAQAIDTTLRRFEGWATSIPKGGSKHTDKVEEKTRIKKELADIRFKERRVIIDQTHKLASAINNIVAVDAKAIAVIWHSHWRQVGYDFREDHKERDEKIYLIRDSWAYQAGLIKPINGFYDQITAFAEEPYCRCYGQYIFNLRRMPDEFLTKKGQLQIESE